MKAVKLYRMEEPEREEWLKGQNLAVLADMYFTARQARLKAQKEVDLIEQDEKILQKFLIDNLPVSEATGIQGKLAHVHITTHTIPTVEDWPKFYAYVKKNNAFELLQRRVVEKAVQERWEARKIIPGVGKFTHKKLSASAIKQKG